MIRVLVVEDSPTQQALLIGILRSDPEMEVLGAVASGAAALDFLAQQQVDVVTMDLRMPDMNGLEVTRRIMETRPVPIVIASEYWDTEGADLALRAMEAGAVAGVVKPLALDASEGEDTALQFLQTVKLMSEVKVIRRWPRARRSEHLQLPPAIPVFASKTKIVQSVRVAPEPVVAPPPSRPSEIALVAIGASTGGPPVLRTILAGLPKHFPVPVVIVQHIAKGFSGSLIQWLQQDAVVPICVAQQGEKPLPGHVYLAPDESHLGIALNHHLALSLDPQEHNLRPAVSYLFRSVASVHGSNAIGVLLTGMGRDGAQELRLLRDKGAITIAQNKETSVVHGMPGAAIALDAAAHILAPEEITPLLCSLTQRSSFSGREEAGIVRK